MARIDEHPANDRAAVPGRGSEAASAPARERLTRERIVRAALGLMDEEGLESVSMRRVGRELGVEAMSLYNHVRDKEDLLDGVTEAVMGELELPAATGSWAGDLREMALEWRRLMSRHPALCQLLVERHKPLDGLATYGAMDAALDLLCRGGLTPREAAQAFNAFGSYIMGFVLMEQGLMPGQERRDRDEHTRMHEAAAEAVQALGFPRLVECFRYFAECPTDEQFGFGLELMVQGVQAMARRRRSPAPTA